MRAGVRSSVTASVALLGAAAIAVTPVEPAATEIPVQHTAVQLSAIPSPLQLYPQVFQQSLSNAGALLEQYFADPFPIVNAIAENQAAAFADAVAALETGRFDDFVAAATDIVLEPFKGTSAAFMHLGALLSQPYAVEGFFFIAISPVVAGIVATGRAVSEVFDALTSLDVIGAVNAFINIPARIIDGVLNGVPDASFGFLESLPGLLSPLDPVDGNPGPSAVGINLDQDMGAAIPPYEPSTAIADIPDLDAATVTVTADEVPAGETDVDTDSAEADGTAEDSDDASDATGEVSEPGTDVDADPDTPDSAHDDESGDDGKPAKVRTGAAEPGSDDAGAGEDAA